MGFGGSGGGAGGGGRRDSFSAGNLTPQPHHASSPFPGPQVDPCITPHSPYPSSFPTSTARFTLPGSRVLLEERRE